MLPSKMTMDRPANTLETRKRIGMNSEYHSGWIFDFAIMKSAASPDW